MGTFKTRVKGKGSTKKYGFDVANLLTKQTINLLETLIPKVNSVNSSSTDIGLLWKVCETMLESNSNWQALSEELWQALLVATRSLDIDKQNLIMEARNCKIEVSEAARLELLFEKATIKSCEQLENWVNYVQNRSFKSIPATVASKILLETLPMITILEFFEIFEYVESSPFFIFDKLNFFNQLLGQNYVAHQELNELQKDQFLKILSTGIASKELIDGTKPDASIFKAATVLAHYTIKYKYIIIANLSAKILMPRNYEQADKFIQAIKKVHIIPNNQTIVNLVLTLDSTSAIKITTTANEYNTQPDTILVDYCKYCVQNNRHADAFNYYMNCTNRGALFVDPDLHYLVEALLLYSCYNRLIHQLQTIINDVIEFEYNLGSTLLTSLIVLLSKTGLTDAAKLMFFDLQLKLARDDTNHENIFAIANGYLKEKAITSCFQFVKDMESRGFRIGKQTRLVILKTLIANKTLPEAQKWFVESIVNKDINLFHTMLSGYLDSGMIDQGNFMIKKMSVWGLKATEVTSAILIEGLLQSKYEKDALNELALAEMRGLGMSSLYSKFLDYYVKNSDWKKVATLWSKIEKSCLTDAVAQSMLRYFALCGHLKRVDTLRRQINFDTHPNSFRILILIYLRTEQIDKAKACLNDMKKKGFQKAYAMADFIAYYARCGNFAQAELYLTQYLREFAPHSRAYTVLIRYSIKYGNSISSAIRYWNQMKEFKVPLDAAAYNSIIAAYSDANLIEKAFGLLEEFQKSGQQITPEINNTLLVLLGKQGRVSQMEYLYQKITESQLRAESKNSSMIALNALMSGYSYAGQWKKTLVLWNSLKSRCVSQADQDMKLSVNLNIFNTAASESTIARFGFDSVTLCIILDAMGLANQLIQIRAIWKYVCDIKFPLTLNNATSFVEGLLRCQRYDEAINIVLNLQRFKMKPDYKILRNTLQLLPMSMRKRSFQLLNTKFPSILSEIDLIGKSNSIQARLAIPPLIQHGLTEDQLKLDMKFQNGTLLLPPVLAFVS